MTIELKLHRNALADERGFTLVELLMAVAIFSLIFLGLVETNVIFKDYYSRNQKQVEYQMTGRTALDMIVGDIRCAETATLPAADRIRLVDIDGNAKEYWYNAASRSLNLLDANGDRMILLNVDKKSAATPIFQLAAKMVYVQFYVQENAALLNATEHYKGVLFDATVYRRN